MDAFIYFYERLSVGRDEIEDALDEGLREFGEVTGGGAGVMGSNIDFEFYREVEVKEALKMIRTILSNFDLPRSTTIVINNETHKLQI
jgi:hypothetical protein